LRPAYLVALAEVDFNFPRLFAADRRRLGACRRRWTQQRRLAVAASVVDLLSELIVLPSVNPRLAAPGEPAGEHRLTRWLVQFATDSGWRWALQFVHPGRKNFLALVPGDRGDTLLFEAHQDTVSSDGMAIEPFQAAVRDGRLYGRGASDVKGSMAAMLTALRRASEAPLQERPNMLLACTVNEECGFTGARALSEIWQQHKEAVSFDDEGTLSPAEVRQLRPSAALVAEPTDMNVVAAHRGVVRWQCFAHGRAAHSSRPEQGANAIYAMLSAVRAIEAFHRVELASRPVDPWCGPSTACVTTIHGGTGANTVPDRAVIDIDRRLQPEEEPQAAYQELVAYVSARAEPGDCRLEHEEPWMKSRGLAIGANRVLAERLREVVRSIGVDSEITGVPYGTNAASIAAAGIPAVVVGPGSIDQAHTVDEWIAIDQLERAVELFYRVAMGALILRPGDS
jgi:acetylornithine deacetylase